MLQAQIGGKLMKYYAIIVLSAIAVGCYSSEILAAQFELEAISRDEANDIVENLNSSPHFDLSSVHIARFDSEGHRFDVTSLTPTWFPGIEQSGSLLGFTADRRAFWIVTLTDENGYAVKLPIAELSEGVEISGLFWLDHVLDEKTIVLLDHVTQ